MLIATLMIFEILLQKTQESIQTFQYLQQVNKGKHFVKMSIKIGDILKDIMVIYFSVNK